jgi:hypothetical protein
VNRVGRQARRHEPLSDSLKDRKEIDFTNRLTIRLTNALSCIATLSGAKGLAARFFAALKMTLE